MKFIELSSAIRLLRKNFVKVSPSIQHTNDFSRVLPNASDDQMTGRLASGMARVRLLDELFDIERLAFAGIERAKALVDIGSKPSQFFDMRQQAQPDLLLIGLRQAGQFFQRAFERLDHGA